MFNLQGHQYDAEGNERDWWQPESLSKFQERIQCIIEQYGNITVPAVNMTVSMPAEMLPCDVALTS